MFTVQRVGEIIAQLAQLRYPDHHVLSGWKTSKQQGDTKPTPAMFQGQWQEIPENGIWGGNEEYYAFSGKVVIPPSFDGKIVELCVITGNEELWAAINPQFSLYVDGMLRQGFDMNHYEYRLTEKAVAGTTYDCFLSAYSGTNNYRLDFKPSLRTVDQAVEKLYYDLFVPWETLSLLTEADAAYFELSEILTKAVNLIDLRKPGSSACAARMLS